MKWIIKLALVIGIPVVAVLAVAAVLLATLDPNDYKDRMAQAFEDTTGRNVEIAGDITTTLFPVLGFEVSGVSIGNPAGYEDDTFLTVSKAQAGVELMPLLRREINISKIILTKPSINVIRQRDGSTNLAFDIKQDAQQAGAAPEEDRRAAASDISIGKIEINDARVTYNDMATGRTVIIDPLNMTLPGFDPGEETEIALDMIMKTSAPPLTVEMNGFAKATAAPELGTFEISGLKAEIRAQSPTFESPLNASITGGGNVNAKERQFALNLDSVKADWQDTSLSGNGTASGSFDQPRISFAAEAPSLNIDTLRATLGNKAAPATITSAEGESVRRSDNGGGKLIPVELVRGLALDGQIKVGKLTVSQLTLDDVSADIDAAGGVLNVAPIRAGFYEGQIDSALSINASGASPAFSLKGAATDIEVAGLLQDRLGQDYLTGRADMNFDLTSRGNTMQAVNSAAGGVIGFNLGEGYINKWELSRRLNQAIAFFETGRLTEVGLPERIRFTSLDATFNGRDGVFRNDDLLLVGPKLHAFGAGAISMASQTVDYTLRAGLGEEADESARHVPVRISGPFGDLNYGLDLQAAMNEFAGEKIEEKKEELIGKALEKLGGDSAASGTQDIQRIEPSAGEETPASKDDPASQLMKGLLGK